jgi:hypothetical protein
MSKETCLSNKFVKQTGQKYTCTRKDGDCCQALCIKGTRCQNKAQYKIPFSQIPALGGDISGYICSTNKMAPVAKKDCCMVCSVHIKSTTINLLKDTLVRSVRQLCIYTITGITEAIKNELGVQPTMENEFEEANEWLDYISKDN